MKYCTLTMLLYTSNVFSYVWAIPEKNQIAKQINITERMILDNKVRVRIYKKERLWEFAGIEQKTNKLALQPDISIYKDQVSVIHFHLRPKVLGSEVYSISFFDTQIQPTLRHGYHKCYYQYSPLFTKRKISKSFVDTNNQPTTIYGNIATCQYTYLPLFKELFLINFLCKQGKPTDLYYKGLKLRAILYDPTYKKRTKLKDLFKQNIPQSYYYTDGSPDVFKNLTSDEHQMFLFDIL